MKNLDNTQLKVDAVCCWRGEKCLFQNASLELKSSDLILLEGDNGVGKTSLLRILAGLSQPEKGSVCWQGQSIYPYNPLYLSSMLYIGHKLGLKDILNAKENLTFYQSMSSQKNATTITQALEQVGLKEIDNIPIKQLSAGQQRRVALARLYLSCATVWLLDEPFTALDKQGINDLLNLFKHHCEKGGSILFTSHQPVSTTAYMKRIVLSNQQLTSKHD